VAAKLKVFRTAVGFRDAYVAAPSKAAALRFWGTDKDLFARGGAELVTDEALQEEPLSKPGEVVYRTRGSLEEQIAALGKLPERKSKPAVTAPSQPAAQPARKPQRLRKPKPRPSRAKLEAAEQALAELENEREEADAAMRERERALAAERATMEARFARQAERLKAAESKAREAYQVALRKWEP
jgi:hypothetical protein